MGILTTLCAGFAISIGGLVATPPAQPAPVDEGEAKTAEAEPQTQAPARTFELTAYTPYCEGCSGATYSGENVRDSVWYDGKRIVASDNAVLPIGTVVSITFASGRTIEAIVLDRGGAIDGAELDLLVAERDKALAIGRQDVTVRIIE